jgi:hypothetical protein
MSYFKEFKTAEQRYRHEKYGNKQEPTLSGPIPKIEESESETEKVVLSQVARFREEDKIDISEDQMNLIQDIFDSIPRVKDLEGHVYKIEFFLTIRKDPQMRKLLPAVARDP